MDEVEAKMIRAYMEATRILQGVPGEFPGRVSLRVGIDCWNWMREKATVDDPNSVLGRPWLARAWGFPVTLDRSMDPSGIIVRKDIIIP